MSVNSRVSIAANLALIVGFSCAAGSVRSVSGQLPSTKRVDAKFTDAPATESDAVQRLIDQAKAGLESGRSTTAILTDPSFLSAHEWPRFRKLIRDSAQPSPLTIVCAQEPGRPLTVTGHVVDGSGQPIMAAIIYIYQTSTKGWYSDRAAHVRAVEGDRKHARLFGYLKTDAEGRFTLHTIRPAGYPNSDLPAHIHVEVERSNKPVDRLVTEVQFDDDPRLTAEWRKRYLQEKFLIAKVEADSENSQRVKVELKMR
jgi:protocatechuate 3,4-dioxygenase beta subunit